MDWTEKMEHKKKIRKMAYRMLWADFKDMVFSWKVIMLIGAYLGYFLLPYYNRYEDFNLAGMYYLVVWAVIYLNAVSETSFNYLPLSTKDIVYYLKIRTNHQISWMVFLSGLSAIVLDAFGQEVFWERGLIILLFMLISVEFMFILTLNSYSRPHGTGFMEANQSVGRKVRTVIYFIYGLGALMGTMLVGMFMDYNENAKIKLLVILCLYLVMYIFRADVVRWVQFNEFNKTPRRSMWGNAEQLNQSQNS
ncbi:MAG: hypothetical protein IKL28_02545 [Lachnospiraceae bacterium]|nr:hypothetical protein [Lachnospiraceae bacterium]